MVVDERVASVDVNIIVNNMPRAEAIPPVPSDVKVYTVDPVRIGRVADRTKVEGDDLVEEYRRGILADYECTVFREKVWPDPTIRKPSD